MLANFRRQGEVKNNYLFNRLFASLGGGTFMVARSLVIDVDEVEIFKIRRSNTESVTRLD